MSQTGFSRIYYNDSETDFFAENFGLADPTPHDGVVLWSELDAATKDFYTRVVTKEEHKALLPYTTKNKLSCEAVNENATLMRVVQEYIRHRYYNKTGVESESVASNQVQPLPADLALPERLFDGLTVHAAAIRHDSWLYSAIKSESPYLFQSLVTVQIFNDLMKQHAKEISFKMTFAEWQKLCRDRVLVNADLVAETTWHEMICAWQLSETSFHPIMNDIVAGTMTGGILRVASSDMVVSAAGLHRYCTELRLQRKSAAAPTAQGVVKSLNFQAGVVLSNSPSRVTLVHDVVPGVDINLDLDPGAAILSSGFVGDGKLKTSLVEPLLYLKGFHVNVDATNKVTKALAAWGGMWWGLVGLDFDVSLEEVSAVTVFQNRLCLVVRGVPSDNLVDPVANGKTAFIEIGPLLRDLMRAKGVAPDKLDGIFDTNGAIYDNVSVAFLQDIVSEALTKQVLPTPRIDPKSAPTVARAAVTASGVDLNLGDLAPLNNVVVTNGRFFADYRSVTDMRVAAQFDLAFDLDETHVGNFRGDNHFVAGVSVVVDAQNGEAYAKLQLPEFWLADLNKLVDGPYQGGAITAALSREFFTALAAGADAETLVKLITADVLFELKRSDHGYVVAAASLRGLATDENYLKMRALMAEFDVAVVDDDSQVYGIISGGEFSAFTHFDGDNNYLTGEFEVRAKTILGSGVAQLFGGAVYGDDVIFVVSQAFDGAITVRPHYKRGSLSGEYSVTTNNLGGQISATPQYENGKITSYSVTTTGLELDVPRASLQFKDNQTLTGKTRAVISHGHWTVQATSIADLLTTDADWLGSGNLKFQSLDNSATLTDKSTGTKTRVDAKKFESNITVNLMRFNPLRLAGSFEQELSLGKIALDTEKFSLESDVQGEISLVDVDYPIATFYTDDTYFADAVPEVSVTTVSNTDTNTEAEVDAYYEPYLDRMEAADARFLKAVKVKRGGDVSQSPEASLVALVAEIDDLGIYSGGDYHKNFGTIFTGDEVARLPLFTGGLKFLNPVLREGTVLDVAADSVLVYDGKLTYKKYKPNKKMKILGVPVDAVEFKAPHKKSLEADSARPIIHTLLGPVNPLALLNFFAHKKMQRVYVSVNQELGLRLGPGEMPTRLADLMVFKEAFAAEFGDTKKSSESEDTLRFVESTDTEEDAKKTAPIISLTDVKKVVLHAELLPSEFDVGVVKVREPSKTPVSVDVTYMPGERDTSVTPDATPYLNVAIAAGPNEVLPHLATDIISRQLLLNGEITQFSGIKFYASGLLDDPNTKINVHIDELASDEKIEALYLPKGYERPALAIVIDGPGGKIDVRDINVVGSVSQGLQVSADLKAAHFTEDDILGFSMSQGDSEKPNEGLLIMDGAQFDDFHIELGMTPTTNKARKNYFVYQPIVAKGQLDTKGMHGYLSFGETDGEKEFIKLTRVEGIGKVDVNDVKISYLGNIAIESEVPTAFINHPLVAYLKKDLGLEIESVTGIEVAGSLDLTLDGDVGGVTRFDDQNTTTDFIPTAITIKGDFKVRRGNQMVAVSTLRVPLTGVAFALIDDKNSGGKRPIVKNLTIPGKEEISATLSGHIELPKSLGSGTTDMSDATIQMSSGQDIVFAMTGQETFNLGAADFLGTITDSDGKTVMAFSSGAVTFANNTGTVNDWDARLLVLELAQGVVSGHFHGKKAVVKIKDGTAPMGPQEPEEPILNDTPILADVQP